MVSIDFGVGDGAAADYADDAVVAAGDDAALDCNAAVAYHRLASIRASCPMCPMRTFDGDRQLCD